VRGLDSLAFALVRATTYRYHQSHNKQEVININHIYLYFVIMPIYNQTCCLLLCCICSVCPTTPRNLPVYKPFSALSAHEISPLMDILSHILLYKSLLNSLFYCLAGGGFLYGAACNGLSSNLLLSFCNGLLSLNKTLFYVMLSVILRLIVRKYCT
jgi:hypothetical protein